MDLLDLLKHEELLRFFHSKKTEMSCMENPQIFLSQLRDHDLILEDRYQEVSRLKSKGDIKKALYDILDQFEREKPEQIHVFWRSVFQDIILNQYPTLRVLHKNLMDAFSLKKREQGNDDSSELPVTCGDLKGILHKDKLNKGEKCILYQQWFTPPEFETFSRKMSPNNWKWSIRCQGTTLGKLMEAEKPLFQSHRASTEEETEEQTEQQQEDDHGNFRYNRLVRRASFDRDISFEHYPRELSENEDEEENPGRKQRSRRMCDNDEEQPGPSSQFTLDEEDETDRDCIICDEVVKEASCQTHVSMTKDVNQKGKPLRPLTETDKKKRKKLSGEEDEEENPGKKQRKRNVCDSEDEQPGPSSQMAPGHTTSLKKAKTNKVVASAISKSQLPVTCEGLEGTLCKDRMAKGEKCILFQNRWFTPGEFRLRAGNKGSKNWKLSIRYYGVRIGKLIKEGYLVDGLQSTTYREDCKKAKRSMLPTDQTNTDEEEETEEQAEQQLEADNNRSKMVFKVTCGALKNYSTVVQTPMWFGKIADRLLKKEYRTVGEFVSDVQLIFTNCALYNRDDAEFFARGSRLKKLFIREFKKVFNISD